MWEGYHGTADGSRAGFQHKLTPIERLLLNYEMFRELAAATVSRRLLGALSWLQQASGAHCSVDIPLRNVKACSHCMEVTVAWQVD